MKTAELIIDKAEKNTDLYYATRFCCPDRYIYFKTGGKKYIMMSDLEIDRAKKTATVDRVLSLRKYLEKAKKPVKPLKFIDAAVTALKEFKTKKVVVPASTSFVDVDYLRKTGFKIELGPSPFYMDRLRKTREEIKIIRSNQNAVFSAMKLAENMIRRSKAKGGKLYLDGKLLTAEIVRKKIRLFLFEKGFSFDEGGPIVACGNEAIDPHNEGRGYLRPNQAIIIDIFPRSMENFYWADATRTFCKGKASPELKKMYNTVKESAEKAAKMVKRGASGRKIHEWVVDFFGKKGYPTGEKDGRMQGFFHGTGHGIGLDIHEYPVSIKPQDHLLKEGSITSVEPGLYYKGIGGVRIEDLVLVTKTGYKVLGSYPKKLEID